MVYYAPFSCFCSPGVVDHVITVQGLITGEVLDVEHDWKSYPHRSRSIGRQVKLNCI
ncbi:hypothetical protein BDV34DRAFT_191528 [Aspergillus parasiticus]|uniref:Uncharacterized protein n=1 Tax=Aspergillus parasiticus TaxID=5067 RepID=A0A5N6DRT0_ASPPA|nr:hypothetical protein BDV34DRAFT_191528 [Aspergillus parasiticus]